MEYPLEGMLMEGKEMNVMYYPYIENAYYIIREIGLKEISRKYSGDLIEVAKKRLDEELDMIEYQGSESAYLVLLYAFKATKATKQQICYRGDMASSYIMYILGLSDIDPLICVPRLYPEFYYGFNGEKCPIFDLNAPADVYNSFIEYFDNYPGEDHVERRYLGEQLIGFFIGNLGANYIKGKVYHDTFNINIFSMNMNTFVEKILNSNITKECSPNTLSEYIKCIGLYGSMGAWKNNAEYLIINKGIPFDFVIANKEDVYEYFIIMGVNKHMAYSMTEYISMGKLRHKGWTPEMVYACDKAGIPRWYRDSCEKIEYLLSRSYAMSMFRFYCKDNTFDL